MKKYNLNDFQKLCLELFSERLVDVAKKDKSVFVELSSTELAFIHVAIEQGKKDALEPIQRVAETFEKNLEIELHTYNNLKTVLLGIKEKDNEANKQ